MQARTPPPPNEPNAVSTPVVEREVETVRTRQRVAGGSGDTTQVSSAAVSGRDEGYLETLPERMIAVSGVVMLVIEGLLGMRFLLRAFGANPNSGFVSFISDVSWPFMRPFANVFSVRTWNQGVIETSTLVAMGFYLLLFAVIGMLVKALAPRLSDGTVSGTHLAP